MWLYYYTFTRQAGDFLLTTHVAMRHAWTVIPINALQSSAFSSLSLNPIFVPKTVIQNPFVPKQTFQLF